MVSGIRFRSFPKYQTTFRYHQKISLIGRWFSLAAQSATSFLDHNKLKTE
jgi:hypothetical protein